MRNLRPQRTPTLRTTASLDSGAEGDYGTARVVSLVDLNLLAGSSDRFRNTVGGYFYNDFDSYGNYNVPPSFYKFFPLANVNSTVYSVVSYSGDEVNDGIGAMVDGTTSGRGYGDADYDQETILPWTQFVCRVNGDPEAEYLSDPLSGNKYWQKFWTGGQYLYETLPAAYNEAIYDDHFIETTLPYENIQKQYLKSANNLTNFIEAAYEYTHYLRNYQNYVDSLDSDLLIPNWYTLNLVAFTPTTEEMFDVEGSHGLGVPVNQNESLPDPNLLCPQVRDYYTFGNTWSLSDVRTSVESLDKDGAPVYPTRLTNPWELIPDTKNLMIPVAKYLNEDLVVSSSQISPETSIYFKNRYQNILFNSEATSRLLDEKSEATLNAMSLPYYAKINFPTNTQGEYAKIVADNGLSTLFLRTLKEVFLEQASATIPLETTQFLKNEKFISSSLSAETDGIAATTEVSNYRSVDFLRAISHTYKTIKSEHADFFIPSYENLDTKATYDQVGVYRSYVSRNAVRTLNDVIYRFRTDGEDFSPAFGVSNINSLLNSQDYPLLYDAEVFDGLRPTSKINEVIAYRIEKIGGPVSGDAPSQSVLQNFWIFNNEDIEQLNFIDSQVKYNKDYTYRVYAYYVVNGFKYKYSNLQISRIIGIANEDGYTGPMELGSGLAEGTVPPDFDGGYCIEFYDPYTNVRQQDLLQNFIYYDTEDDKMDISSLATDAQRIAVSPKSTDQYSMPPYIADFVVTVQPSIKVIEVPLLNKTYRILDAPPNELDVIPNYHMGNSNTISFDFRYEGGAPYLYPRTVTQTDEIVKEQFLKANDYVGTTIIDKHSVSQQSTIEIYRLNKKPTSFKEFDGQLYDSLSLKMPRENFSYTTATFDDTVRSNTKYYYLFRATNELGIAGTVNTIIEAELINDGGYKYATFEVLQEEDLEVDSFKETTAQFRQVLQFSPNLTQTEINSSDADFLMSAKSQYENIKIGSADDLIWDKTFKIRLTSKKTGKKIDLNITYSDPDIKLEAD